MHTNPRRRPHPCLAALTAAAFAVWASGCAAHSWRAVPITEMSLKDEGIATRTVRLMTPGGQIEMEVVELRFPFIEGVALPGPALVALDVQRASGAEAVDFRIRDSRTVRSRPMTLDEASLRAEGLPSRGAEEDEDAEKTSRGILFYTDTGTVLLELASMEYPRVTGRVVAGKGTVTVDLREVSALEVHGVNTGATIAKTLGIVAGVLLVAGIIVAITKESCPFVYVDRGSGFEIVGEAYAGAMFSSLQRDDLLPLPAPTEDRFRVRLSNEARETQYTDRAELVLVDHAPGVRAVSSFDGQVLLVGPSTGPAAVHDLESRDVALVAEPDGRFWQTDLVAAADAPDPRLREGLHAVFPAPEPGTVPVLEIVGGNTPWLDLVFGRYFASIGDRLDRYVAKWSEPAAGDRLARWKQREGVDLQVQVLRDGQWRRVAIVPTVGPIAPRHIAIPLDPIEHSSADVEVRLSGGLGFWRVDALSLSTRRSVQAQVHRLAPTSLQGIEGRGDRGSLAATDGRYHALRKIGESVDLSFELPPLEPGRMRTAFFSSNGYYVIDPPVQGRWSPGTLRAIRDEPGALSRFSLDLARSYKRLAEVTPRLPMAPEGAR